MLSFCLFSSPIPLTGPCYHLFGFPYILPFQIKIYTTNENPIICISLLSVAQTSASHIIDVKKRIPVSKKIIPFFHPYLFIITAPFVKKGDFVCDKAPFLLFYNFSKIFLTSFYNPSFSFKGSCFIAFFNICYLLSIYGNSPLFHCSSGLRFGRN